MLQVTAFGDIELKHYEDIKWGPIGKEVYERTYQRIKQDGTKETWQDTVERVVEGNTSLVDEKFIEIGEQEKLFDLIYNFKMIPAGRHLWCSGVPGRQFLQNCHRAGFTEQLADHYGFAFDQLMQGGGVGANYSNRYINQYGSVLSKTNVSIVCDSLHSDHHELKELLSDEYSSGWDGCIRIDDSREGWVEALESVINSHLKNTSNPLVFDVSLVRARGQRIRGFGGKASGPLALSQMLLAVNAIMNSRYNLFLTSLDHMSIDHEIAKCVVAGNVRRCLPGETLIHCEDGLKRIDEIKVGQKVLTSSRLGTVSAVFNQGKQNTIKIKTQLGEFECTPNHKIAKLESVNGEYSWIQAKDLLLEDRILFIPSVLEGKKTNLPEWRYDGGKHSTTCKDIDIPQLDKDVAWFFGNFFGDGYTYPNFQNNGFNAYVSVACSQEYPEIITAVESQIKKFGVNLCNVGPSKEDNCTKVRAQSKQLAWYMAKFKMANQSLVIPKFILEGEVSIRAAFVAGLYDADGSDGRPINLVDSIYPDFLRQVQSVYASLGIATRFSEKREVIGSWKALYTLSLIGDKAIEQFINVVGPHSFKGITRRVGRRNGYGFSNDMAKRDISNSLWKGKWDGSGQLNHDVYEDLCGPSEFIPVSVISINDGRYIDTYDIEVETAHEFIAQGILVHNSARMSIKSWKDGDIFDFINCKKDHMNHWSTNISVEIDDDFFKALKAHDKFAREVYQSVVEGMLTNGEPGFYNLSLAQDGELGDVGSTNPCGELPLEPWENCCLGHVNLSAFVDDFEGSKEAFRLMTRFLIRATFGDMPQKKQREIVAKNRRIGVGFFGFQGWLVQNNIRYSDSHRNRYVRKTLRDWKSIVDKEKNRYAFQLRIPEPIKGTTVAPTGSIAKLSGDTEGLQPIFGRHFIRRIRFADNDSALEKYIEKGYKTEPCQYTANTTVVSFICKDPIVEQAEESLIEQANEISLADMLAVQAMVQECYADNAISFTVNVESDKYTVDSAMDTIIHYLPYLKGTTIMPNNSRPQAPYELITKEQYESATIKSTGNAYDECSNGCPVR